MRLKTLTHEYLRQMLLTHKKKTYIFGDKIGYLTCND